MKPKALCPKIRKCRSSAVWRSFELIDIFSLFSIELGTADEISTVEKELKDLMGRMRSDVTRIQMELFQALCNDVSDHTPQLVAKLNSELKGVVLCI